MGGFNASRVVVLRVSASQELQTADDLRAGENLQVSGTATVAGTLTAGNISVSDGNITNVGVIEADTVQSDANSAGLNINFDGNTTKNKISLKDNLADALNITQGGNSYIKFITTNSSENILVSKATQIAGSVTIGDATAEDTFLLFDGNAQDYRIGVDDGTDILEIGAGTAHGSTTAIKINGSGEITQLGDQTNPTNGHFLKFDGAKIAFASVSSGGGADTGLANTFTEAQTVSKDQDSELVALILKNESDSNNTNGLVSLRFDLEDTGGNAVDSAKIAVKKEAAFTATASTQDSSMVFSTSLNGTLTEQATLDSAGKLTVKALDAGDGDITNVGTIEADVIQSDADGTGLNVNFDGNTTKNFITLKDNLADALNITEGSNSYMKFTTTNSGENILVSQPTVFGVDDTGVDIRVFSATTNEGLLYDASEDELGLLLTTKLSFHDVGGGESIHASGDGTLEIAAGTELKVNTDTVTFASANANDPLVVIKNTTNDVNGARLQMVKDRGAAAADGDDIGSIEFVGDNAAQEQTSFAKILAEASESADTDEAGKLSFFVAESNGTSSQLTAGLILEGEHATDGEVDVTIGAGAASTTTVAGDLAVTTDFSVDGVANLDNTDIDGTFTMDGATFDVNASGLVTIDSVGLSIDSAGVAANITSTTDGAAEDFTIALAGATDSSLILSSTGTGVDALQIATSAGGMDITVAGAAAGEDLDLSCTQELTVTSTSNAANAIYLRANAGTSETIKIHADQGSGAGSIELTSDAGGVDINAATTATIDAAGVSIDSAGVAANFTVASDGAAEDLTIEVTGATDSSVIVKSSGTGADAISLATSAGGMDITVAGAAAGEDLDISSNSSINVTATENAANTIVLHANGGTSETIKIHSDQGTSVTEGAASVSLLSDAGGVELRSTADLANAINITNDGGTSGTITIFNDQGTSVTEGAASVQLLSDAGGIGIKSTANLANAVLITADGGTDETIVIHSDQGTGEGNANASIELLSDAGGICFTATGLTGVMTDGNSDAAIQAHAAAGGIGLRSTANLAGSIQIEADGGADETIVIHSDQGTGEDSITLTSDAGGIDINAAAGKDVTVDGGQLLLTSAHDVANSIYLRANAGTSETIKIHADQGTGAASIELTSDAGSIDINAADNITIDSGDDLTLTSNTADGLITLHSAHTAGQAILIDANADAGSILDIDAGILDIDVQADAALTAGSVTVTTDTATFTSANANDPVVIIQNTNDDANGSTLKFVKDGGNVADGDVIGNIAFVSEDDGDAVHTYAQIIAKVDDMTGGAEEGSLEFHVAENDGTLTKGMDIVGLGSDGNVTVDISTHDGAAGGLKLGGTLVTSTAAELNLLDLGNAANAASAGLNAIVTRFAKTTFTFAGSGMGDSTATFDLPGVTLPDGAILVRGFIDVRTNLASDGAATLGIGLKTGTGVSTTTLNGSQQSFVQFATAAGGSQISPLGGLAAPFKLEQATVVTATIAGEVLTAGVFDVYIEYIEGFQV